MIPRELIVPYRRMTLKECDTIIHLASGAPPRVGKASDGTLSIAEASIDWWATKQEELEEDEIFIICGNCTLEAIVDMNDSGLIKCTNCGRKLVWRLPNRETPPR